MIEEAERRSSPDRILFHEFKLYFYFYFFFNLTYSRWTSSLPSCLWSQRIFPSLPGSRLTVFYRDASSALLQLVNQWLNFTYSRSHAFRYERKNTNLTLVRIELTTSALAGVRVCRLTTRPLGRRVLTGIISWYFRRGNIKKKKKTKKSGSPHFFKTTAVVLACGLSPKRYHLQNCSCEYILHTFMVPVGGDSSTHFRA